MTNESINETTKSLWVFRVRVRRPGRVFLYLADNDKIKIGDKCIVNTNRGMELGVVVSQPQLCDDANAERVLDKIVRIATESDLNRHAENQRFEKEAFHECHQMIMARKMPMKLVYVEATFDRKKVVFYFSAENRVDFRDLVKDLACKFRTRIELRQIGVRDEARLMGGLGVCGRSLCCSTFLKEFAPVSIRMAKKQHLALNPSKISGLCGRLMCCILFEDEQYTKKCACEVDDDNVVCGECKVQEVIVAEPECGDIENTDTPETGKTGNEVAENRNSGKKKRRNSRRRRGGTRKKKR